MKHDVLQMKQENVLKLHASETPISSINLDFQVEQDVYKGKIMVPT